MIKSPGKLLLLLSLLTPWSLSAAPFDTVIAMIQRPASTYYVSAHFDGAAPTELMVDTGSAYVTVNTATLKTLAAQGKAVYQRELVAVLADGSEQRSAVYKVAKLTIGKKCAIADVEVAAMAGSQRQILGLSALRKVAPFALAIEPPGLMLSQCGMSPELNSGSVALNNNREHTGS